MRKTLTLKRPTLSLRKKKPEPEQTPEPKPKKAKEPTPKKKLNPTLITVVEEPATSKSVRAEKHFTENYKVWADYLPLEIGTTQKLKRYFRKKHPEMNISGTAVYIALEQHLSHPKYLQNVIDMEHRYNLDGEITNEITAKQKAYSERKLKQILEEQEKNQSD